MEEGAPKDLAVKLGEDSGKEEEPVRCAAPACDLATARRRRAGGVADR